MNNKGFAITSIIYGLMLLFIVIITSFLSILVGRNRRMDELVEGVYKSLEYERIIVASDDFKNSDGGRVGIGHGFYETEKRGLYYFEHNDCDVFLPKNTVVIAGYYKNPNDTSNVNNIYYNVGGSSNLNNFKIIDCINR